MTKKLGIWIDREKALVVAVEDDQHPVLARIESGVEGRRKALGGGRALGGVSLTRPEERRRNLLQQYYQRVIEQSRAAAEIAIFGPGLAKKELLKEMEREKALAAKVVSVQTLGFVTEPQLIARVRAFFADPDRRPQASREG